MLGGNLGSLLYGDVPVMIASLIRVNDENSLSEIAQYDPLSVFLIMSLPSKGISYIFLFKAGIRQSNTSVLQFTKNGSDVA